jgi:1-acyl-sn-glycerol-3-phosphate acyltransferase
VTVHDTRFIRSLMRRLAQVVFACAGWRTAGQPPSTAKYVVIAAPHTSNWDFLFTLCLAFIYRLRPRIMMKASWFFWPLGPIFKWIGAIPIDRSRSRDVVAQSVAAFARAREMALVVPPAGTRKRVMRWKTGFYHIAHGARVPIAMGFLDYRRKVGGFGPSMQTSGDIDSDMRRIRCFYDSIRGKHPLNQSPTSAVIALPNTVAP